ncbi:uncharacterized protein LOC115189705 isoform X4 [Salmo trutta]|uniref:C1q domain-containing protein n=1 Tax=Salmo trutta TaxID=8032 RepID=A0A674CCA5_SALTR|nr:uncharacterized protein LOC115189705 isoform X4 [Salmo trutta]
MRTFVVLLFVLCSCLSELQVFQSRDNDKKPIFLETTQRVSESQVEEQRDLLQELRAIVAQQSTKLNEMGANMEELKRDLLQELRAIVAQQSTKLNEMGANMEEQRVLLQELRAIVAQQSTKLNEMGANMEEQRVLLQELRAIVAQQSTKLNEMGANMEEQRDLLQELRAIVAQQSTKLNEMGATVEELKRENRERPKVAFSASLSESKGPNSDDGILVYKHVFNNIDSEDGGSNGVTLKLDAGDEVYTRLMAGYYIFDDNNHHSTFTGFLLFT